MLFMLIKRDAGYDFDVGENLEQFLTVESVEFELGLMFHAAIPWLHTLPMNHRVQ